MCDHCGCRSFPAIAELTAEHERILALAWDLAESGRSGDPIDPTTREQLLALLDAHVAKEETGLYPVLLTTGGASTEEIALLEQEHLDLHGCLTDRAFGRREYYALAAHVEAEEMELFPAAMFGFDDEEWAATTDAHRTVDAAAALAAPL